jgi:hypothetical protein
VLLETCRNVDAITEHIKLGCHNIAEMHRHAQRDRCAFMIVFNLPRNDLPLHLPSPFDRVMRTRKLDKNAVSGGLYQGPMELLGLRRDHLAQYPHPALVSACFVIRHQDRVANDVDEGDGGKSPIRKPFGTGFARAYRTYRNLGSFARGQGPVLSM